MVLRSTFGVWGQISSPFASFWGWCLGPFEGLFLRSFLGVLRSFLVIFEVIFGHFWPLFVSFLGQFWVFLVILVVFGLFCFTRSRLFGADVRFLRFWSFLTYFDRFWGPWEDQKRPLSHFLDPQKKPFSEAFQAAIFRKHKNSILAKVDPLNFGPSNRTFYRSNEPFHFSKCKKL